MQSVAAWLDARPLNAILAMAVLLTLPPFGLLSGAVLVTLVLAQGTRRAVLQALAAALLVVLISSLAGVSGSVEIAVIAVIWTPSLVLAVGLRGSRSLTLTLQVSVLVAAVAAVVFQIVIGDPIAFWESSLMNVVEIWREAGLHEQADLISSQITVVAPQMTVLTILIVWSSAAASLVFGQALYKRLPRETADYGCFRDLNFGRVIASAVALTSVIAFLSGAAWLQSIAFFLFVVFWFQGLAIVHWLQAGKMMSPVGVVIVYVLLVVLNGVMAIGLAVFGYVDAWFRLRRVKLKPV